jgi:hypothetical protein
LRIRAAKRIRNSQSEIRNRVAQRVVAFLAGADVIELAQSFDSTQDAVLDADGDVGHGLDVG